MTVAIKSPTTKPIYRSVFLVVLLPAEDLSSPSWLLKHAGIRSLFKVSREVVIEFLALMRFVVYSLSFS
jgi:hypothetical protein